jgi:hypothetical protein
LCEILINSQEINARKECETQINLYKECKTRIHNGRLGEAQQHNFLLEWKKKYAFPAPLRHAH